MKYSAAGIPWYMDVKEDSTVRASCPLNVMQLPGIFFIWSEQRPKKAGGDVRKRVRGRRKWLIKNCPDITISPSHVLMVHEGRKGERILRPLDIAT